MKTYYYTVEIIGGIESALHYPFEDEDARDEWSRAVHTESDPDTDGVFWLDVAVEDGKPPVVKMGEYSGGFFIDDEGEA
jgi:hypothetical protein